MSSGKTMYNDDDKRTTYNRGVNPDPNQNNYTEVPRNTETINNIPPEEYRDGYVHGRVAERRHNEDRQVVRDNNNAARGLLLGIILTSLLAIPALVYYLWNRQNQEPVVAPDPAPVVIPSPSPQPQQPTIIQERVIERTPEVQVVPIPQGQTPTTTTPAPTPQATPNINITIPPTSEQQPADTTQQLPANQQTENQLPGTSTQQLPSVQNSPSPGVSGTTNPNFGEQGDTTTPGNGFSPDGSTTTTPGNNASPSTTGNTNPAGQ